MTTPNGNNPALNRCCPNCRGPGTLIAAWTYIDTTHVTQRVNGEAVPNELERSAELLDITAPEVPTPPTVQSSESPRTPRSNEGESRPMLSRFFGSASSSHLMCSSYPIKARLTDGRPSIIIDPGSVGNLCGDKWAKEVAILAHKNGHMPKHEKRHRPLEVCGVGNGSQQCHYDCSLPVAFRQDSGNQQTVVGNLFSPAVADSELPGLLGLTALRKNRAVLDFTTLKLYFCGPADYDVANSLPEGTDIFQLELAPSGHIVLPCCEYEPASTSSQHTLTLLTRSSRSNSSSSNLKHTAPLCRSAPPTPPPPAPPTLPSSCARGERLAAPPSGAA